MYRMGIIFWVAKISNTYLGMPDIPNIFYGKQSKPTYEEKHESTPPPPFGTLCMRRANAMLGESANFHKLI